MKLFKRILPILFAALMLSSLAGCSSKNAKPDTSSGNESGAVSEKSGSSEAEAFPRFKATDFEGNEVDNSLFAKNKVTLLNFWFNDCSACVGEMSALEQFNKDLAREGAEIVGVNVDSGEAALAQSKQILSEQGATYRNMRITGEQDALDYLKNMYAFPTTILVDQNGNIIGKPIVGSLESEETMASIMATVKSVAAGGSVEGDTGSKTTEEGADGDVADQINALMDKENEILMAHTDEWTKVFAAVNDKDESEIEEGLQIGKYGDFLQKQVDKAKEYLTEEEYKVVSEDLVQIQELEKQILELNSKN